jgi:RNA-directed DNA polymerase
MLRLTKMKGEVYYIRYLDDFVLCFQYHADAVRFRDVLVKRLEKFSLQLEPSKTRLVEFGRFAEKWAKVKGKPLETIYFLGFTLYCSRNRSRRYKVGMKTEKSRLKRSYAKMKKVLGRDRHKPLPEQRKMINVMLSLVQCKMRLK